MTPSPATDPNNDLRLEAEWAALVLCGDCLCFKGLPIDYWKTAFSAVRDNPYYLLEPTSNGFILRNLQEGNAMALMP